MNRDQKRLMLAALLAAAGLAPVADGSLVCWTENNGQRNWGNCTAPCGTFFSVFGNYCSNHPDLNVRCYDITGSALTLGSGTGGCESCMTGFGPGIDGAGYVGRGVSGIYTGTPFFIVQASGAMQCVIRNGATGVNYVATIPPGPDFGVAIPQFIHITRAGEQHGYLPTGPYCGLPDSPAPGPDFSVDFGAINPATLQFVSHIEVPYAYSQLAFRQIPPVCPADINGNTVVNTVDLTALLGHFGAVVTPFQDGDTDGDGRVDTTDLVAVLGMFGQHCP